MSATIVHFRQPQTGFLGHTPRQAAGEMATAGEMPTMSPQQCKQLQGQLAGE
jgi:hypothetical protein